MSRVHLLKPADGWEGIKKMVVEAVATAGPNPCPPVIVGAAVGGSFELAAREAKKQLLRPIGSVNADPEAAELEAELFDAVNASGVGPAGLGGVITALAVHLRIMPCHIASLPLAVNIQCHSSRHAEAEL
jgi:fumarate hydratase subunit alpha